MSRMDLLATLGWADFFEAQWTRAAPDANLEAARVVDENREGYFVAFGFGTPLSAAILTGKHRRAMDEGESVRPTVGDWVLCDTSAGKDRVVLTQVLERFSKISRKVAGNEALEQVIATNINTLFLATSLNLDLNFRRLERYLALCADSGARPVVLLTKVDLAGSPEAPSLPEIRNELLRVAAGVPVHPISSLTGEGLGDLAPYFSAGQTCALIGSSGAGKSSLVNRLLGAKVQFVADVREGDDRGRHATTARSLHFLPTGGMLIDTPGMRELQLWDAPQGLDQAFQDVADWARQCKFTDCKHTNEPGCQIQAAIGRGELDLPRLENFRKLERELEFQARKTDARAASDARKKWKKIGAEGKQRGDLKRRY